MSDAVQGSDPATTNEFESNVLDLGREELAPLRKRYSSNEASVQGPLFEPPNALIVTHRDGSEALLRSTLEEDGWFVKTCSGPGQTSCPVLRGERCPLRESVDAAVVYVDPREPHRFLGTIPRLRCAADSSSPGVVALEGGLEGPRFEAGTAIVGALRGPDAVLRAIAALQGARNID